MLGAPQTCPFHPQFLKCVPDFYSIRHSSVVTLKTCTATHCSMDGTFKGTLTSRASRPYYYPHLDPYLPSISSHSLPSMSPHSLTPSTFRQPPPRTRCPLRKCTDYPLRRVMHGITRIVASHYLLSPFSALTTLFDPTHVLPRSYE
jgi:hypothetical protein